jgi:hypothetical protein
MNGYDNGQERLGTIESERSNAMERIVKKRSKKRKNYWK